MSSSARSFMYSRPFAMQAALGIYAPRRADANADIYEYEENSEDEREADGANAAAVTQKAGKEGTDAGQNTLRPKV